jgi:hypothetical protein
MQFERDFRHESGGQVRRIILNDPEKLNALTGALSQVARFERPIDPVARPLDVRGIDAFAAKRPDLQELRKRSSSMWADQRI